MSRDGCNCVKEFGIDIDKGAVLVQCRHYEGKSLALVEDQDGFYYVQRENCDDGDLNIRAFSEFLQVAELAFDLAEKEMIEEATS